MNAPLSAVLAEQLDWHWANQLRPRLDGLRDEEYLWEPVPGCWSVRDVDGRLIPDFAYPPPEPAPVTTIAWRCAHLIVGVFGARTHAHFGGQPADYQTWHYALDATTALDQLDRAYRAWTAGVRGLSDAALSAPCGPAEGPYAAETMATLVLHINREVIHHGAEIALLRDLYTHTYDYTH